MANHRLQPNSLWIVFFFIVPCNTSRLLNNAFRSPPTDDGETQTKSQRQLRIAYGVNPPSQHDRFPYSAVIAFENAEKGEQVEICTGILIQPRWLLTAGSCIVSGKRLFISIGNSRMNPRDLINQEEADLVAAHFIHPFFKGNPSNGSNLGLLYLKTEQDVSLPRLPSNESPLGYGMKMVGIGWGITDINDYYSQSLRIATSFQFYDLELCRNKANEMSNFTFDHQENLICVRGKVFDGTQGICKGDEGGPLLQVDPSSYDNEDATRIVSGDPAMDVLYGIASFGPERCGNDGFSVYSSIVDSLEWINSTINTFLPPQMSSQGLNTASSEEMRSDRDQFFVVIGLIVGAGIFLGVLLAIVWYKWNGGVLPTCPSTQFQGPFQRFRRKEDKTVVPERPQLLPGHPNVYISPFLASRNSDSKTLSTSVSIDARALTFPNDLESDIAVGLIGKRIGSGAFGDVEEGLYVDKEGTSHQVAVKTINVEENEAKEALINELQVFERVGEHPNIVHCFGGRLDTTLEDPSGYYIIEELMVSDLGKYFKLPKTREEITFRKFLQIFYGIANGLEHLHDCEIIHFDLKPGNILLDKEDQPKLADFGCSRRRARTYITVGARGTMAYMAPELWLIGFCVRRAQVRASKLDIFSYGVVMWETLTNQTPFDPLNVRELLKSEESQEVESGRGSGEESEEKTNEEFRNGRFPFPENQCPADLKTLMYDCLSYYNSFRPTASEIKQSIQQMLTADWIDQKIDHYHL